MKFVFFVMLALLSTHAFAEPQTVMVNRLVFCQASTARNAESALEDVSGKLTTKINSTDGVTVSTSSNRGNSPMMVTRYYKIKPPFAVLNVNPTVTMQDTFTFIASACVILSN